MEFLKGFDIYYKRSYESDSQKSILRGAFYLVIVLSWLSFSIYLFASKILYPSFENLHQLQLNKSMIIKNSLFSDYTINLTITPITTQFDNICPLTAIESEYNIKFSNEISDNMTETTILFDNNVTSKNIQIKPLNSDRFRFSLEFMKNCELQKPIILVKMEVLEYITLTIVDEFQHFNKKLNSDLNFFLTETRGKNNDFMITSNLHAVCNDYKSNIDEYSSILSNFFLSSIKANSNFIIPTEVAIIPKIVEQNKATQDNLTLGFELYDMASVNIREHKNPFTYIPYIYTLFSISTRISINLICPFVKILNFYRTLTYFTATKIHSPSNDNLSKESENQFCCDNAINLSPSKVKKILISNEVKRNKTMIVNRKINDELSLTSDFNRATSCNGKRLLSGENFSHSKLKFNYADFFWSLIPCTSCIPWRRKMKLDIIQSFEKELRYLYDYSLNEYIWFSFLIHFSEQTEVNLETKLFLVEENFEERTYVLNSQWKNTRIKEFLCAY